MDFDSKSLRVNDYMILPSSICDITLAENMFRDAHHYFHLISRNFESYTEIAKRLHESVFLTDEELYAAVSSVCHKTYGTRQPSLLVPDARQAIGSGIAGDLCTEGVQTDVDIFVASVDLVDIADYACTLG